MMTFTDFLTTHKKFGKKVGKTIDNIMKLDTGGEFEEFENIQSTKKWLRDQMVRLDTAILEKVEDLAANMLPSN